VSTFSFTQLLAERAELAGLTLESRLTTSLEAYFELLRRWNRRINLTGLNLDALTGEGMDRLFVEPLLGARHLTPGTSRFIDLGSGGGSPAIPMALAVSSASLTMVESRAKKSVFLREAARELGLEAQVITARYEDALSQGALVESFDALTSRALRLDARDIARVHSFVRDGGWLLLFRSAAGGDELKVDSPLSVSRIEPLPRQESQLLILIKKPDPSVPRGTSPEEA